MDTVSNLSQMSHISKFDLENYNPELSFQINLDKASTNTQNNKNYDIDVLSNDIRSLLTNELSESVMNLTRCFIYLAATNHPVSCPKCNNFACKKCFEDYFGEKTLKNCPLCKQGIRKKDLKRNKTVREIEKILYNEDSKTKKIKELTKLVNEKKKIWENQESYLNYLINKLLKYEDNIKEYKKEYDAFFSSWKSIIDKIFEQFETKIREILDLLLKYNQKYNNDLKSSIIRINQIKEKNKVSNNDISSLVNEILIMERNHFNEERKKQLKDDGTVPKFSIEGIIKRSSAFFIMPMVIMPNISNYSITFTNITTKDINKGTIKKKDYNVHIGYYQIEYIFEEGKYLGLCQFYIKNDRNISFFVTQKKKIESKYFEIIPMKLVSDSHHNIFEAKIDFEELKEDKNLNINIETKIQIFSVLA